MNKIVLEGLLNDLAHGDHAVLVTLCSTDGSTPRKAGAKMLVRRDGTILGTVGGGSFEFQAIKKALEAYEREESLYWQCDLGDLGMICGGQGTVLIEYL